jgi:hypothetical protein
MSDDPPLDLAELDHERHKQDRAIRRGYDVDPSAPSHEEFVERERQRADKGEN